MRTKLCETFGIEHPIFAFTRSPAVAAAVSKAGGMGVLGAVEKPPEELKSSLAWMDEHVDGKPYGVDVVMPVSYAGTEKIDLEKMIPEGHVAWINDLLARNGVPDLPPKERHAEGLLQWLPDRARKQIEISFEHPVKLIASALGPPPPDVIQECHQHGLQVAALCGNKHHAEAHVEAGVDIVIAQGTEAGGHTGDVSTMVLVPEIADAVTPRPVLAAGGIGRGRQIAAALALGAEGVWTGSIWLTVEEADTHPVVVQKLIDATSRDTVRSRSMTGKPARQLRTPYTEAWDADDSPGALPLPLQFMLTADATQRLHRFAGENEGAARLVGSPVGQIVGSMSDVRSTRDVMASLVREYEESARRMSKFDIPVTN
jgi:NAD(P)H-dependent flavin oxidoreductase YrpB (nitropropane dioxygenase family)